MLEAVIVFLIWCCIVALVIYLVIYVLGVLGVPLPPKALQILWLIFGLVVILFLVRMILPLSGRHLMGALPLLIG